MRRKNSILLPIFESDWSFQDAVAGWVSECFSHVPCPWVVNKREQVGDAIRASSLYHLLDDGAKNKPAEENKGKAPLGEAVAGLWSYLTRLPRDGLWCSANVSPAATHSHGNNCQTCSWARRLPRGRRRRELLFILSSKNVSRCRRSEVGASQLGAVWCFLLFPLLLVGVGRWLSDGALLTC